MVSMRQQRQAEAGLRAGNGLAATVWSSLDLFVVNGHHMQLCCVSAHAHCADVQCNSSEAQAIGTTTDIHRDLPLAQICDVRSLLNATGACMHAHSAGYKAWALRRPLGRLDQDVVCQSTITAQHLPLTYSDDGCTITSWDRDTHGAERWLLALWAVQALQML